MAAVGDGSRDCGVEIVVVVDRLSPGVGCDLIHGGGEARALVAAGGVGVHSGEGGHAAGRGSGRCSAIVGGDDVFRDHAICIDGVDGNASGGEQVGGPAYVVQEDCAVFHIH